MRMKIGGVVLCGVLGFCFWIVSGDDDGNACGIYNTLISRRVVWIV